MQKKIIFIILFLLVPNFGFSQTCNKTKIQETTPDSNFIDNGNETITDKVTGLMWKKCSEGLSGNNCTTGTAATFIWQKALDRAKSVRTGGFNDWRLPNIKELESIIETACYGPSINLTFFPQTQSNYYWSSSFKPVDSSDHAMILSFKDGYNNYQDAYFGYKKNGSYVRLVRDGQ